MPATETDHRAAPARPRRRVAVGSLGAGGLAGLLAGAAGVAVSEALAALLSGVTSPLLAVGNRAVDATPRPLKEFAIETFGDKDKPVLITGVIVTVALLAVLLGVLGVRRPRLAFGGFLLLSVVATAAALTDRAATAGVVLRLLPALALLVVSTTALLLLLRTLRTPARSAREGRANALHPRVATGPQPPPPPRPSSSRPGTGSGRSRPSRTASPGC